MIAINQSLMQKKYNVTKKSNRSIKYIVVHNTGTTASAESNCRYFGGGNRNASADFFINTNGSIYQFNADIANYYSWHCGGGKTIMNSNSIGIEVVSDGKEFTSAEKEALKLLIEYLCNKYKIDKKNIVRHYDATKKVCPMAYSGSIKKDEKWQELKAYLQGISTVGIDASAYKVRITASSLNVRSGPSTLYKKVTSVKKNEVYTIVEEKGNWGRLKSGTGWISLKYTTKC